MIEYQLVVSFLFLIWVWALIDVVATERGTARGIPKIAWWFVVFLLPTLGAVIWLLLGRPEGGGFWPGGRRSSLRLSRPGAGASERVRRSSNPYGDPPPAPVLDDGPISDRRSAELDRQLDEWLARRPSDDD